MGNKIMVVDDDLPTLEVMELLLRKINREPLLVHNGWDALRMIKKEKPALVILDVMMSPIDGWQFLEELKRNEDLKDMPVLLFTAKHVWPEEYSRYAEDIVGVLEKPISLAELKAALERVLPRDPLRLQMTARLTSNPGFGADNLFPWSFPASTRLCTALIQEAPHPARQQRLRSCLLNQRSLFPHRKAFYRPKMYYRTVEF